MEVFSGSDLQDEREAAGLSPQQLADLSGLSGGRSHLRKIERGLIYPRPETLRRIQRALDEHAALTSAPP